jgi:hypothetical protein
MARKTGCEEPQKDTGKPLPLVSLLTKPVMLSISNYAMLALLDMSAMALVPLVWSMPIDLGGLILSPASIGMWLSAYGCLNGILQFVFFPRVVLTSMATYVIIYTMFPFENLAGRYTSRGHDGPNATIWLLVLLQLLSICITDMRFSASFFAIATPVTEYICVKARYSFPGTLGPAAAASLLAFSLANDVLNGNFVYVVLLAFVCVALCVAAHLPRYTCKHGDGK